MAGFEVIIEVTVAEVASHLGVWAATVYKLCATGVLRHIRVLNAVRVVPRDLTTFVAGRAQGVRGT